MNGVIVRFHGFFKVVVVGDNFFKTLVWDFKRIIEVFVGGVCDFGRH